MIENRAVSCQMCLLDTWMTPHEQYSDMLCLFSCLFVYLGVCGQRWGEFCSSVKLQNGYMFYKNTIEKKSRLHCLCSTNFATFHRNTVFLSIAYRSCMLIWIVHLHFMYYLMEHLFFICFVRALSLEASAALRSLPNPKQRRVKLPLHV